MHLRRSVACEHILDSNTVSSVTWIDQNIEELEPLDAQGMKIQCDSFSCQQELPLFI